MRFKQELASIADKYAAGLTEQEIKARIDQTISKTFAWVAGLLLISFWVAYATAFWLLPLPFSMPLFWASWIWWLWIIFYVSRKWQSLSYKTIATLLVVFALLEGYGLSGVFMAYEMGAVYNAFLTTWISFAILSFVWYRTNIDITRVWPILFVALIALIIALVFNMFWQNEQFDIWISIIWLVIFAGFIIYDMNLLKQQALLNDDRTPLLIALGLFINFINIFLFLLRLMGGGD